MSSTDGSSVIAEIPFSISGYEDLSGNEGAIVVNSTTDGTSVKYDPKTNFKQHCYGFR